MNKLPRYEALVLVPTESTNDDISTIERQIDDICSKSEGSMISFDRWGKYQLCFPVRKHSYGVYLLVRFEVTKEKAPQVLKTIDTLLKVKHNELVMRYVISKMSPKSSLEYEKPESLDATRDTNLELKEEAKIEHLLDTVEASTPRRAQREVSETPEVSADVVETEGSESVE